MLPSVSSQSDSQRRQEAAEWHSRLQSRAVSNAQLERFYAWRADEANALAFAEIERVWQSSVTLADDPEIKAAVRSAGRRHSRGWRVWWPIVAVPTAMALAVMIFMVVSFGDASRTYSTDVGERLVVRLDDGSRLTLDTATSLVVRYGKGARNVELRSGQALFEVARDPARPFRVTAGDTSVTALGTEFSVRRGEPIVRVILVHGRIAVVMPKGPVTRLDQPGEVLETATAGPAIRRTDPGQATSWTTGTIDLRDATLAEAIAEVNRYSRRRIVLDAKAEAGTKVSGVFATDDPDGFAAAVANLLPLRQTRAPDGSIHLEERR